MPAGLATAALTFAEEQAARYKDLAKSDYGTVQMAQQTAAELRRDAAATISQAVATRDQAKVNLKRTQIRAPVDGWVTNLLTQLGDYATVGKSVISLVDADSFWVDAYFEETQLASIREGDPANVKLMGYSQVLHGKVGSVARAITVSNARADQQGLATVNPIFTWVRLAQRVPVRIQIKEVPDGVRLVAGMTATIEVVPRPARQSK